MIGWHFNFVLYFTRINVGDPPWAMFLKFNQGMRVLLF